VLDRHGAELLDALLIAQQESGVHHVRVDLRGVTAIESAGVIALLNEYVPVSHAERTDAMVLAKRRSTVAPAGFPLAAQAASDATPPRLGPS
jgi:ABC-type transporter Mla MlaB component